MYHYFIILSNIYIYSIPICFIFIIILLNIYIHSISICFILNINIHSILSNIKKIKNKKIKNKK